MSLPIGCDRRRTLTGHADQGPVEGGGRYGVYCGAVETCLWCAGVVALEEERIGDMIAHDSVRRIQMEVG